MDGDIVSRTMNAIRNEILASSWRGLPAKTIFFGGGTPTFPPVQDLISVFEAVLDVHPPISEAEITSEANPGTVDAAKFHIMRQAGFNRISLGAQSFQPDELVRLERVHAPNDIERAVHAAREAGFANLNLDLMFALPGQRDRVWRSNLKRAIALEPEHLSLYCLTLEPNTRFWKLHEQGELQLEDDTVQVRQSEATQAIATENGYFQYEISNFCKPGYECQHNLSYWRSEPYAGYGPGAVGCMDGLNVNSRADMGTVRYTNWKHPATYSQRVEDHETLAFEFEHLDPQTRSNERLMLGLRLTHGVLVDGLDLDLEGLDRSMRAGWVERSGDTLKLTPEGRHFCSEVTVALMR